MLEKSGRKVLVFVKRTYFNFSGGRENVPSSNHVKPMERMPTLELNQIPKHIRIPDYARQEIQSGKEPPIEKISILTPEDVKKARRASQLARKVIHFASTLIAPGVSTDHLNSMLHDEILRFNAYPSTLFYEGFPKSISTSVNNIAVHGVPDSRQLQDGDILTIDATVYTDEGFHGDCCETFCVGENIDSNARHLLSVTKECLYAGISTCGPKVPFASIGSAIKSHAKRRKLSIVPHIIGHGIGAAFHSPPEIYHTLNNYPGLMEPGMLFTIEPCLSEGGTSLMLLEDTFSYATVDGSRTAQCEHTVLITEYGVEILSV